MRRILLPTIAVIAMSVALPYAGASSSPSESRANRPAAADDDPAKPFGRRSAAPADPLTEAPTRTEATAGGYVFVPITPYRTFDSRDYVDGFMLGGDEIYFDVLTNQLGVSMIPSSAVAVTYNLTVTDTLNSGYLAVYPAYSTWPGNSSINWTASGFTLANGGTVAIGFFDAPGQLAVYCGPNSLTLGTDFLIDITGYYI